MVPPASQRACDTDASRATLCTVGPSPVLAGLAFGAARAC